jgi:hypothetical protein
MMFDGLMSRWKTGGDTRMQIAKYLQELLEPADDVVGRRPQAIGEAGPQVSTLEEGLGDVELRRCVALPHEEGVEHARDSGVVQRSEHRAFAKEELELFQVGDVPCVQTLERDELFGLHVAREHRVALCALAEWPEDGPAIGRKRRVGGDLIQSCLLKRKAAS